MGDCIKKLPPVSKVEEKETKTRTGRKTERGGDERVVAEKGREKKDEEGIKKLCKIPFYREGGGKKGKCC